MRRPQTAISEVEFESLPPALRRKYFSSLERLRLAQDGTSPSAPPQLSPRHQHQNSISSITRPKTATNSDDLDRRLRRAASQERNRLKQRKARETPINRDRAAWFASLPPAIQRKHFTKEEQILLANEGHHTILDATDEVLHRRRRQGSFLDERVLLATRPNTSHVPEHHSRDTPSPVSSIDMGLEDYSVAGFRWLEDNEELDLTLDDYHTEIANIDKRQHSYVSRRQSFRRNMSLTSISIRRSSLTSPVPGKILSRPVTPSMQFHFGRPASQMSSQHRSKPSVSSIDPRPAHYQDPAARMKLRAYLATPSKFDEAIEFGFPSVQEQQRLERTKAQLSPRNTNDSSRTFFSEETPSLSGDDGDEVDTINDPRTPEDSVFRQHRPSTKSKFSADKVIVRPQFTRGGTDYSQSSVLDREMTLHMTLTRPDLRSPEETRAKEEHVNSKPLQQPDLYGEPAATIWDTLPLEESKVKKFFKKLKFR